MYSNHKPIFIHKITRAAWENIESIGGVESILFGKLCEMGMMTAENELKKYPFIPECCHKIYLSIGATQEDGSQDLNFYLDCRYDN